MHAPRLLVAGAFEAAVILGKIIETHPDNRMLLDNGNAGTPIPVAHTERAGIVAQGGEQAAVLRDSANDDQAENCTERLHAAAPEHFSHCPQREYAKHTDESQPSAFRPGEIERYQDRQKQRSAPVARHTRLAETARKEPVEKHSQAYRKHEDEKPGE